jgi:hypothetical protein
MTACFKSRYWLEIHMNCTLKSRKGQVLKHLNDLSIDLSLRRRLEALHTLVDLSDLLTFAARSAVHVSGMYVQHACPIRGSPAFRCAALRLSPQFTPPRNCGDTPELAEGLGFSPAYV